MAIFRVPFTTDPERRERAFRRLSSLVQRFGSVQGTIEAGTFQGSTPIGGFAGAYESPEGSEEIYFRVDKKPFLVSMGRIESELRKLLSEA